MAEPTYSNPDAARAANARTITSTSSPSTTTQTSGSAASGEIAFDVFVKNISQASNEARLALAQQLKDAGIWTGKVSSKFDLKYYTALAKLEEKFQGQVALDKMVGSTVPTMRYDVLTSIISGGGEEDGDGPTTTRQTYITSPSQTAKLLDAVAVDLLERKLTKAEKAKYLKMINAEQRKQPSIQTAGKGFVTTKGGIDEEQFITEKIESTSEAKNVRATDAYAIMMQEFGGLR
jgi:hypothetical protein